MYGLSGWMDKELFHDLFERQFLHYAPGGRLLLLLLDGHSTYYQPKVMEPASEKGIILFALPPHTIHVAHPLDVTPFHSLKLYWNSSMGRW